MPVGDHVLTVARPGGSPRAVPVQLRVADTVDLEIPVPAPARVSGHVRAATDGRPLREARVSLLDRSGRLVAATATDLEGRYVFPDVPQGNYVVSAAGYDPVEQPVAVAAGRTTSSDVVLGRADGQNGTGHNGSGNGSSNSGYSGTRPNGSAGHSA